jgi:hypothetical protein
MINGEYDIYSVAYKTRISNKSFNLFLGKVYGILTFIDYLKVSGVFTDGN